MTIPANDGCPWPVDPACLTEEWEAEYDTATQVRAIALASNTLRRLTGYRVGGCPVTVRPGDDACLSLYARQKSYVDGVASGGFVPLNWAGVWTNLVCNCVGACRHNPALAILLPPPVWSVSQVKIDGNVLVSTAYFLATDGYLLRIDGSPWPSTQNFDLPDTAVGTFSVTYLDSAPVDGQGAYACGKLALEYARACKNKKCTLPAGVVNIVRQGVTFSLPTGSFPGGETGLRDVDAYVALWNPGHRKTRPKVWSP